MYQRLRLSFRAFTLADLQLLELLPDEREAIEANASELSRWADKNEPTDYKRRVCVTTLLDEKPLFVAGYYEIEPGTAQVFIIPDRRVRRFSKSFVRAVRDWLRWLEGRPWCERIQTVSLPTEDIDRWMLSLGFT